MTTHLAFTTSPADRTADFRPVEGGTDTVSAEGLLLTAYLIMWALIFGFVLLGWRRQTRLAARLTELEQALARAERAAPPEAP